jgi:hypothetical protein
MIMSLSCQQDTTELVDWVYAMLEMLSDDIRQHIIVDYSAENRRDYWRTYVQLFKALLRRYGRPIFTSCIEDNTFRQAAFLASRYQGQG